MNSDHVYTPDDYKPGERPIIMKQMVVGQETKWEDSPRQTWAAVRSCAYAQKKHGRHYTSHRVSDSVVAVVRVA